MRLPVKPDGDPVLEARNAVLIASRSGGDVTSARASLQVAKAMRAIALALEAGPTVSERQQMALLAGGEHVEVYADPFAPGTVLKHRRSGALVHVLDEDGESSRVIADADGAPDYPTARSVKVSTLKKTYTVV